MPSVYETSREYKLRLDRLDADAVVFLVEEYAKVASKLKASLDKLVDKLDKMRRTGRTITEADLYLEARYREYVRLLREEMRQYAALISKTVSEAQEKAVILALDSAEKIFQETYKNAPPNFDTAFMRFDEYSARQIVSRLSDIKYLEQITGKIEIGALMSVREILINGVVQGIAPKKIAGELTQKLDIARTKAETIARTEIISAYREGNLSRFQTTDVVKAWQWSATLDDRTCPICVALDGKEFPLYVPFATHPSCRCSPLPVTKSWDELGLGYLNLPEPVSPITMLRGERWFESISEERKKRILGVGKYELYSSGKISLDDLVESYNHPVYGPSRQERTIKSLKTLRNL